MGGAVLFKLHHVPGCLFTGPTYPPLALSKVFTHLTADRFMDVLAESSVSGNPEKNDESNYYSCISCILNPEHYCNNK